MEAVVWPSWEAPEAAILDLLNIYLISALASVFCHALGSDSKPLDSIWSDQSIR